MTKKKTKKKKRDMTQVEIDAIAPLQARRNELMRQIDTLQNEVAVIEVALNGMATMMHGRRAANIGIDLDTHILYETK